MCQSRRSFKYNHDRVLLFVTNTTVCDFYNVTGSCGSFGMHAIAGEVSAGHSGSQQATLQATNTPPPSLSLSLSLSLSQMLCFCCCFLSFFLPKSPFSADSLTVSIQPACAIARIKYWQLYYCLDTRKYCTHWCRNG